MGRLVSELPLLLPPRTCQKEKERGRGEWNEKGKADRKKEEENGGMCMQSMMKKKKAKYKHANSVKEMKDSTKKQQKKIKTKMGCSATKDYGGKREKYKEKSKWRFLVSSYSIAEMKIGRLHVSLQSQRESLEYSSKKSRAVKLSVFFSFFVITMKTYR